MVDTSDTHVHGLPVFLVLHTTQRGNLAEARLAAEKIQSFRHSLNDRVSPPNHTCDANIDPNNLQALEPTVVSCALPCPLTASQKSLKPLTHTQLIVVWVPQHTPACAH